MNEIRHKLQTDTLNGVNYIVVAVGNDPKSKDYRDGNIPCNRFRLPAIKEGTSPNVDGYFPLHQLTYTVDKGTVKLVEAVCIEDKYCVAFYDDINAGVYFTDSDVERYDIEHYGIIRCYESGRKSHAKYYYAMWNYFIDAEDATAI